LNPQGTRPQLFCLLRGRLAQLCDSSVSLINIAEFHSAPASGQKHSTQRRKVGEDAKKTRKLLSADLCALASLREIVYFFTASPARDRTWARCPCHKSPNPQPRVPNPRSFTPATYISPPCGTACAGQSPGFPRFSPYCRRSPSGRAPGSAAPPLPGAATPHRNLPAV